MKHLSTTEIRSLWIEFFQKHNHELYEAKSLVPVEDETLLFINSGVATLKKYLDGTLIADNPRIVNSQKSLRTNDIDNVGITSRHQTLFEMLGNFSIGDYFKEEVVEMAIEFLTSPDYLAIQKEKLYFTIHPDDQETKKLWIKNGISEENIVEYSGNYWEIGKGPGGPNTEVFYDRGISYDARDVRKLLEDDLENDRIIEIWGIVFSQFNCQPGEMERHLYPELPSKNIDTGMGLERIAMLSQNVETTFETDNFQAIIQRIELITGLEYKKYKRAMRIQADHIRAVTFAIADGILPSSEGRGYVIRRLIRRAQKYGVIDMQIGPKAYLYELVDIVAETFEDFYPYLLEKKEIIKEIIQKEEKKFLKTISAGLKRIDVLVEAGHISGQEAFILYDTYGMPVEITKEIAEQKGLTIDLEEFEKYLNEQKERARSSAVATESMNLQSVTIRDLQVNTTFVGYEIPSVTTAIEAIIQEDKLVDKVTNGEALIILKETPFYATSGGQVADGGQINDSEVIDVIKTGHGYHLQKVIVNSELSRGQIVTAQIDESRRMRTSQNHSVTHLLHLALHKIIGPDATQAGSLQDKIKTRFDFHAYEEISQEQIKEINKFVNEEIEKNSSVEIVEMPIGQAKELGANALFGEKYGEIVRVVTMGDSIELCGGTHIKSTGEIKSFYITQISGIGSGVKRIEGLTDTGVIEYVDKLTTEFTIEFDKLITELKSNKEVKLTIINQIAEKLFRVYEVLKLEEENKQIIAKLDMIIDENEKVKAQNAQQKNSNLHEIINKLYEQVEEIEGIKYLKATINDVDGKDLRLIGDELLNKLETGVILLVAINGQKVAAIAKVSPSLTEKVKANQILNEELEQYNGKGGGNSQSAQGGGALA